MDVKYINPFIVGSRRVLEQILGIIPKSAPPRLLDNSIVGNDVIVLVGLTGEISGQVMFTMNDETAIKLARTMTFNDSLNELDFIAESAISEIGNMISGATGIEMYSQGITINITPPTLCKGDSMSFSSKNKFISVPLEIENYGEIFINISFEKKD